MIGLFVAACLAVGLAQGPWGLWAQQAGGVQWIWFNEGDPVQEAPAQTRYFRKVFAIDRPIQKPVDEATLDITADSAFTVWVNGALVGKGSDWKRVYRFDVQPHLVHGKNVIAVEATNSDGPAGLLVRLGYVPNGLSKLAVVSDASWKASRTAAPGWQKVDFTADGWSVVKAIGPYGQTGPWRGIVWDAGGDDRFAVPPGFRVEMAVKNPSTSDPFSLVNLTFDARGRLLVSKERGPVLLCTQPDATGLLQSVLPYCDQVRNCQGMCWVKDALLLVGDGPQGTGLYRVRDTDGDDKTDAVELLHKFKGGMGEHGPHAILHGPDGWLYLVLGNHAWAQPEELAGNSPLRRWPKGLMGPDQGKPGTTEDVLLPRLNDSRGHAANILAPGGTIWRLDHDGRNMSLVAAGFRNHYDAAFSPWGELFTFDSDMEWDEGLPWYRAVRVCHCPPGADFVWRTGAANTLDYYLDSLPPAVETGRGSPVGVEFYDHVAFPAKYRGAFFVADWAIGIIFAIHLERDGASYKGKAERFCAGAPMNVTDCVVGPDGALYFTMGGRGTQGGVYRIVYQGAESTPSRPDLQPLSAWSRQASQAAMERNKPAMVAQLLQVARGNGRTPPLERIRALDALQNHGAALEAELLLTLAQDKAPEIRAHAVWLLGVNRSSQGREALLKALKDEDALVRRRACEALIRAGIEPPVAALWPLLGEPDRFVRTAARLVLERIDPEKWADQVWKEAKDLAAFEGIIALCKVNRARPYAEPLFGRLRRAEPQGSVQRLLEYLRTVQMALIHAGEPPDGVRGIARQCEQLFPHADWRVNRELAILLTHFRREGLLEQPVHAKLLSALAASRDDRQQQIHYFYCLRLLHDGWTPEQKNALLAWYDSTQAWVGGHSFTPFLENILQGANPIFTAEDRSRIVARAEELPWAAAALLRLAPEDQLPSLDSLAGLHARLSRAKPGSIPRADELRETIVLTLGRGKSDAAQAALRKIADADPGQRDAVVRALARSPSAENWPYLVRGLESPSSVVAFEALQALKQIPTKPKADDPAPYRALLLASRRLFDRNRWQVVELLRHWSNDRRFGAEEGEWQKELSAWSRWFGQAFPKEPPLPDIGAVQAAESKYKFEELREFLESDPAGRKGDVARGRLVFEKAQCLKCHKFGKEGEGIGPDLTTLAKRFKRVDTLESMLSPSKVISDQYRSTLFSTKKGQQILGLAAPQGETVTILQSDGTKVTLRKDEIDLQFASLVSVMPEKLLDTLTKEEIADLFAFLESEPN
jgi:putative heme-binding domain-containing protein